MNPSLLSQPLSPTHAKPSVLPRLRTFTVAFALAAFVLLLWANAAHAEDGVDPTTSSSAAPAAPVSDAGAEETAAADNDAAAPVSTPEATPEATTVEPADEPSPVQPVSIPVPAAPRRLVDDASTPGIEESNGSAASATTSEATSAAPAAAPATGRRVPVGFVQATLVRAQAHSAPAVHQCNADTFPTSAGWEASCVVTVENTLGSDGSTGSRVTTTWCLAEAGVLPPEGCTTDVSTFGTLVSTVDQCNGILAGGSNVTCSVEVINNVPSGTPTTEVTVNQCIGSGQGGVSPGGPPTDCDPVDSSTTGATVTQCNGSANGGGGPERVQCSVTGGASALPVTVNQCNGSTAAGSTVTCDVTYTNNFAAAAVPVDAPTPTPLPTPVVPVSAPVDAGPGRPGRVTSAASSTSSAVSLDGPSGTATNLAATGASASTSSLLLSALLLLVLGALLLAGARRPGTRPLA